jgi:hypothetical protein
MGMDPVSGLSPFYTRELYTQNTSCSVPVEYRSSLLEKKIQILLNYYHQYVQVLGMYQLQKVLII